MRGHKLKRLLTLGSLLASVSLIAACNQPDETPDKSSVPVATAPAPGSQPGASTPLPSNEVFPAVGDDAYLDLNSQVVQVAVPFLKQPVLNAQAVLPTCGRPDDTTATYFPGASFLRRQTFPGDPRLDGVNEQYVLLDGLLLNPRLDPYDAPVRKVNGTAGDLYEKDASGNYKTQTAYPDIFLLGGAAGAGEYGRELNFGFRYVRVGTANGLPGFEPYLQLGDPRTGRVSVVNLQPVVNGVARVAKVALNSGGQTGMELVTDKSNTTRLYLTVNPQYNTIVLYTPKTTASGTSYSQYLPKQGINRLLLWEGKVADLQGKPDSLDNQIRKFELRVNYGPFVKNNVVYTKNDASAMNDFIAARTDFVRNQTLGSGKYGTLGVAQLDSSGGVTSKTAITDDVFQTLQDPRQECSSSNVLQTPTQVTVGNQTTAASYSPSDQASYPPLLGNPLPSQIALTSAVGQLASEPVMYEYFTGNAAPSVYIGYSLSSGYALSVRQVAPGYPPSQGFDGSNGYALDFTCKKTGHYDIPVSLWDAATPTVKKPVALSADCVTSPSLTSDSDPDPSHQLISNLGPTSVTLSAKVGSTAATAVGFDVASVSSYRLRVDNPNTDLTASLKANVGLMNRTSVFLSYDCKTAGTLTRTIQLTSAAGSVTLPVSVNCVTQDTAPVTLPARADDGAQLTGLTPAALSLSGSVGDTLSGKYDVGFKGGSSSRVTSLFGLTAPDDLTVDVDNSAPNVLSVLSSFKCVNAGTFTRRVLLSTQLAQATSVPLDVSITCQAVVPPSASAITLSGTVGQTLTGASTVKNTKGGISISYATNLPTTITTNADGSYQLNVQYQCTAAGTFTPLLKVTDSTTTLTVSVTITCQAAAASSSATSMSMSGTVGQTLTGTSKVSGVKSTLTLTAASDLPTTSAKNADGTYTLTSTYKCASAGTFSPSLKATVDGTVLTVPVSITCAAAAAAPTASSISMSGTVGQTLTGTSTVTGVKSSISITYASDLPTTVTQNTDGTFKLTSTYKCVSAGTFSPSLKATVDGTVITAPVSISCYAAPAATAMSMSGLVGQVPSGSSTISGVRSTLSVTAASDLPTSTSAKNSDGTYTLTSTYKCAAVGSFSPSLKATVDGTVLTVPVSIACYAVPTVTAINISGTVGQTLTGTSTVSNVRNTVVVNALTDFPTTSAKSTNGTYILTAKYKCTKAGTYKPTLSVTVDGSITLTVPSTVTCK